MIKIFLLQDIPKVGLSGEIIKTTEGYARNYLIPKKLGVEVTPVNELQFKNKIKTIENRKEVIASKTSILSEKIKSIDLILKRKMHDGGKLYGSIGAHEIVDALSEKGIAISKNQVDFDKAIKAKGLYTVKIKLSSQLIPSLKVKIISEEQQV